MVSKGFLTLIAGAEPPSHEMKKSPPAPGQTHVNATAAALDPTLVKHFGASFNLKRVLF